MNVTIKKLNDMGLVVETLSDSSYMVSSEAFKNCYKLKRIVIPKKKEIIADNCFAYCSSLEEIIFDKDNKIDCIDTKCFYKCCNLEFINIPNSVTHIDNHAFSNCENLLFFKAKDIYYFDKSAFSGTTINYYN